MPIKLINSEDRSTFGQSLPKMIQTGTGLIEVLIALIIISVGMLGIASLYVTTLQAKTTSLSRMKAIYLAQDMADRMRANPTAITSYNLASTATTSSTSYCATSCTDAEKAASLAAYDLYEWDRMIFDTTNGTGLPGTVVRSIAVTAATASSPSLVEINLGWNEVNSGTLTYTLQVQL